MQENTKFYRHYKNKPYKYLGTVKHSESLEDLVLYECRYENTSAKIWVRPKKMFFEKVEIDGKQIPRFEPLPISLESITTVTEAHVQAIAPIMEKAFGEWDPKWFYSIFNNHKKFHLGFAYLDRRVAGFKLGYEVDGLCFYSWLGGVLPEFQGLGVARALMEKQHQWCREQGYRKVQTQTQNRFKNMLLLDLKMGFEIIGTQVDDAAGGTKILLEKTLAGPANF